MGRISSKTKSSKKKSSKLHSEALKKKKTKTTKSKKLSSRKDYSSSSSDGSESLVSLSTFSSDEEHYRSRSRRKGELKGSKKRAPDKSAKKSDKVSKKKKPHKKKLSRKPSFTSLSSDSANSDPDASRKLQKKRHRREPSIDSISSGYSSDENGESERLRGRFREKNEVERDLGETKRLKVRARSYSPYDRYEDTIEYSVPIVPAENNFRRLRSVITVPKPEEDEERDLIQDVLKEEIEHDHSSKRDEDSVSEFKLREVSRGDGGEVNDIRIENRREEVSPVLRKTENDLESILRLKALENMIKFKGAQIEKLKAPTKLHNSNVENRDEVEKLRAPTKLSRNNGEEQSRIESESITIPKKTQKANLEVNKNVVDENSKVNSESVPTVSKNRGVVKSSVSEPSYNSKKTQNTNLLFSESNVDKKTSIPSESVSIASKNVREIKSSVPEISIIPKKSQSANSLLAESNVDNRVVARTSETAEQARKDVKCNSVLRSSISDRIKSILEKSRDTNSSVAKNTVNNKATLTSAISGDAGKKDKKYNDAPKFSISESSSSRKPPLEENISKEHENTDKDDTKSSVAESTVNYKANLTSAILGEASKKDEKDNNVPKYSISEPSSSRKPPLEEKNSNEHEKTDKDGSQFEQKTMSVMRGGEMVQVSYKVYIPKKAPALARRPLMRK